MSAPEGSLYEYLIKAIIYQQLSGKAAATIHSRFIALCPAAYPDPHHLLNLTVPQLRSVGLSNQKSGYVQNVARHFVNNEWLQRDWSKIENEHIIAELTQIKGVGRWTVEMILMSQLGREDVFPLGDLGIQKAIKKLYGLSEKGKALQQKMSQIAQAWQPYRSYACRYLWRYIDGDFSD